MGKGREAGRCGGRRVLGMWVAVCGAGVCGVVYVGVRRRSPEEGAGKCPRVRSRRKQIQLTAFCLLLMAGA